MICNTCQILLGLKQGRQCTYKCKVQTHSRNHFSCGKVIRISYSERVSVRLNVKYEKRTRHNILSFMACTGLPNFQRYFVNGTIVGKKCK